MVINLRVVASRLKRIRETLAYSTGDVGQATGIDENRLLLVETGSEQPSGDEILILASFYDCDFQGLVDDTIPAPGEQSEILFRRYGDTFGASDRRAVQEFLHLCQIEEGLERSLRRNRDRFTPAGASGPFYKHHGQTAAEELRRHLRYGETEASRDVFADFRSIGIHIFRRRLENDEISGLYVEDNVAGHCVLINYNEDIYRQRFSVAHEVAHSIFDSSEGVMLTYVFASSKYDKREIREIRANSFASNYLMPRSMLGLLPKLDATSARHWAQEFRVSTTALAYALKDARLVSESTANMIRAVRVPREEKIDPEVPKSLTNSQRERRLALLERGLSSYYVELCFDAHDAGVISTGRLIEALKINSADLADICTLFGRTIRHDV